MKNLSNKQSLFIIASCVLLHRVILFLFYHEPFVTQVNLNSDFIGLQYLAASTLEQFLSQGLWQLQQSPPIPNLLLAIGIKLFGFPTGLASYLVLLQGLISCLTAMLIFSCLSKLQFNKNVALVTSLLFAFSTDLLLMEYSVLGQAIHESLTMLLVITFFYCLLFKNTKMIVLAGICTGLLAITRSYFFLFPLLAVALLLTQRMSAKQLALFLLPVILLQGGWALKNIAANDYFSLQASTFSGFNLENALASTGHYQEFNQYVKQNDQHCPDWLQTATDEQGISFLWMGRVFPYMPKEKLQDELKKIEQLGGDRKNFLNSDIIRSISDCYRHAWFGFALSNPEIIIDAFKQSYVRFWQPLRSYTRSYIAFFYPRKLHSFLGDQGKHKMNDAKSVNQVFIMQASLSKTSSGLQPIEKTKKIPANTFTLGGISLLILYLNFFTIHVILPATLLLLAVKKDVKGFKVLFHLTLIYSFTAVLTSLGENGENNRFRLAVEPVIWLISCLLLQRIYLLIKLHFIHASASELNSDQDNAEPAEHAILQQDDH